MATRHDDGFTGAIQCKFVAPDARISKQAIDSFISASAKPAFSERIIVETTAKAWSPNAETMLQGQAIPTTRIGLQDLIASDVDWTTFAGTGEIARREPRTLRPDQVEALNAVRSGLAAADRGKLIMACGTGKTLTALRVAEDLAGPKQASPIPNAIAGADGPVRCASGAPTRSCRWQPSRFALMCRLASGAAARTTSLSSKSPI